MFRPVFLFKILILSLIFNFVLIIHFLFQNGRHETLIDKNQNNHHDVNDYYLLYDHKLIPTNIKVIPMPMFVQAEQTNLFLSDDFRIGSSRKPSKYLQLALTRYSKYITSLTGITTTIQQNLSPSSNTLIITCTATDSKIDKYPELGEDESYTLNITTTGSYLFAPSLTGIIRGLSTFVQLIERDSSSSSSSSSSEKSFIPCVSVVDRPRFPWRGLLLDVSRHWMPVSVIERTLNAMELSKLNVLHLHLSDDQGFRVESVKHHLLHDRKDFFTQKDIRHLIEYAKQRRIRIIPEFDIPGHTTSWFVGYPELATAPSTYEVETRWGVMKPTMDPTKESTYVFLDDFFKEMTELFPDPYFHIGGDEVEGSHWAQSPSIQHFILKHKLENKNGLQAHFNKRIQTMLKKYGKIIIGWEEILDEMREDLAIDKEAIIQSWKSRKALTNTIDKGYRGLLSTGYYLDHLQPATYHYRTDPIFNEELWLFNEQQLSYILGGEACMWSEYVSQNTVDSRIWPRILAVAERFWSPSSINDSKFVYDRLFRMNHLLDRMQTGVTHLASYKQQLQNLIVDPDKKQSLLRPFALLADVCEPGGFELRAQSNKYSSIVPLTTFIDALQSESELVWKLETLPPTDKLFRDIFQQWSLIDVRLRGLFDDVDNSNNKQLWGQDIEQLSKNLARTGQIGLRVLDYGAKRILHHDKNHTMNTWPLLQWIVHHNQLLDQLENQVYEVRLAAVRPVRRLLNSIKIFM